MSHMQFYLLNIVHLVNLIGDGCGYQMITIHIFFHNSSESLWCFWRRKLSSSRLPGFQFFFANLLLHHIVVWYTEFGGNSGYLHSYLTKQLSYSICVFSSHAEPWNFLFLRKIMTPFLSIFSSKFDKKCCIEWIVLSNG